MAWIESHTVLGRHRKVLFLAHELGTDPIHIVGHLHVFWHAILEQQEDGDLSQWPAEMIAGAAGWKGDATQFVAAMKRHGWIDDCLVHDWLEYTGKFLHSKYSTSNPSKLKSIYEKYGYKYGKGKGKYAKVLAQEKRKKSADQARLPNLTKPNLPNLTKPTFSEDEPTEAQAKGRVDEPTSTVDRSTRTRLDRDARTAADRNARTLDEFGMTPELEAWSAKEGIADPSQYVEEFKDYWRSAGGKRKSGQAIKDWDAAFRNRLRALKDQGKLRKKTFDLAAWAREETA